MKTIDERAIMLAKLEAQKTQAVIRHASGDFRYEEIQRINDDIKQLENQ